MAHPEAGWEGPLPTKEERRRLAQAVNGAKGDLDRAKAALKAADPALEELEGLEEIVQGHKKRYRKLHARWEAVEAAIL